MYSCFEKVCRKKGKSAPDNLEWKVKYLVVNKIAQTVVPRPDSDVSEYININVSLLFNFIILFYRHWKFNIKLNI